MPLITRDARTVPVTVQARCAAAPAAAFAAVVPMDITRVFPPRGPVPGVVGVRDQSGPWDHVGAHRVALLSDGSRVCEQITEYVEGHSFAYELAAFTGPLRHLLRGIRGEWTFTPDGDGSMIRWNYELAARPGRHGVLLAGPAALWRRVMTAGLAAAVATAAEDHGARP